MDLLEYRTVIFDKIKFSTVPDSIRKKHYYMLLRFFATRYPVEASQIQSVPYNIGTRIIHSVLSRSYTGRLPQWAFTKGNTTKDSAVDPLKGITQEARTWYWNKLELDSKDVEYYSRTPTPEDIKKLKSVQAYLDK